MAFTTCTVTVNNIASLSDLPNDTDNLTAAQLKAKFDKTGSDLKDYINNTLITELEESGANGGTENIGIKTIAGIAATKLQGALEEIVSAGSGSIPPDASISNAKLATDVKVGSLADLDTTEKSNVVGAINEVVGSVTTATETITTIKGVGWTTETIKSNADNLNTHAGDTSKHIDILTTRGDILRRGASLPERLVLSTASEKVLMSNGIDIGYDWAGLTYIAETIVGAGGASSIEFTSITQQFRHLMIEASLSSEFTTNYTDELRLKLNDKSSGHASSNFAAPTTMIASNAAYIPSGNIPTAKPGTIYDAASVRIFMPFYSTIQLNKSLFIDNFYIYFESGGTFRTNLQKIFGNISEDTVGLSRIKFYLSSGSDFEAGSKVTIYGIK